MMVPADDTSLTENGSAGTDVSAASLTEETDPAVRALAAQNAAGSLRGVYPQDFWSFLTAFGDNILAGKYQNADDSTLLSALQELQSDCAGRLQLVGISKKNCVFTCRQGRMCFCQNPVRVAE